MSDLLVSIGVIFVLLLVGFLFSAAEMALVTLRDSQIQRLQAKGKRGRAIMALTDNPNRFLSSVQIGVTLAGFLSSAFGSDSLAGKYLAPWFESRGMAAGLASVLAVVVVTAIISFLSIVLSELHRQAAGHAAPRGIRPRARADGQRDREGRDPLDLADRQVHEHHGAHTRR